MLAIEFYTLLAVTATGGVLPKYSEFSAHMNVPTSALHNAVQKLIAARLMTADVGGSPRILMEQTIEFICFGAAYVFPAKIGILSMGIPTAAHAPPMSIILNVSEELKLVWASSAGKYRGESINPVHIKLPDVALRDESLYHLATTFDSIRIGGARERSLARELIHNDVPKLMLKRYK